MSKKITFSDLVNKIVEETGESKKLIHDLLIETKNITSEGLERDGRVNISELGHFDLKWHKARSGRNPQTGEEIEIPAHNTINFKATSSLREYINRKYAHLKPEFIEEEAPGITPVPPILPEPEPLAPEPVPEYQPDPIVEEKKSVKSIAWLWLIIPIIIIILAFLFWPSDEAPEPVVEEPAQSEILANDVEDEPAEQLKPVEEPEKAEPEKLQKKIEDIEQPVTPAKNFKPETKDPLKPVKEPAPTTQESVTAEKEPVPVKTGIGTPGGTHSIQPGDNFWTIAMDFYKQSYLWPKTYLVYKELGNEKALYYLWVVNKWEAHEVIEKYKNRINETDLKSVEKIDGFPVVK
ncbi:hypothetical protein B6I21_06705 [candidate division KSB1 bacterium 4572_119]|nr:MAG: hypothetical protein B6I21_06705 [candidate division KSB1 bacterium 4572_119]